MDRHTRHRGADASAGFSLVEVLIAAAILAGGLLALSQLALASGRLQRTTQEEGLALELARRKIEQIRSLSWTGEGAHLPRDLTTDLTVEPPAALAGVGLTVSPADALSANRPGYCDLADASGDWLSGCDERATGAAWVRRWSITTDPRLPAALLIDVAVFRAADGRIAAGARPVVLLSSVRTGRVP